ncbi:MAG TPA: hypothetical protein VMG39_10455 [Pseudolabrys sp.]|nr:hypothetical protein [Pseudolabrys sp.]
MRQSAKKLFLVAAMAGALAACGGKKEVLVDPNLFPANYKQEIIDTLARTLVDPTNIRNAFISDPALTQVENDQRYTACVRYTARDAARQYGPSTDRIAYFYGGHLNQLVKTTKDECAKAAYKPFPELEKLCRSENKCM